VRRTYFFDLDNTLHDAGHAIFGAIDARMTAFVAAELQVDAGQADHLRRLYWRRYGATLLGLVRHHGVDPARFLRAAHDFDVPGLLRAEPGLAHFFARLPGRKVLVTNAPAHYAQRVLHGLGLDRHLTRRYAIETMRLHGRFRPKPSPSQLRMMLARERVPAARAVLIEDSAANLKAARAVGLRTVLITGHSAGGSAGRIRRRPPYVDARLLSVRDLLRHPLAG
jgi:putative hydrolase of the HAD superfamily